MSRQLSVAKTAEAAKAASRVLAPLDGAKRTAALEAMAVALNVASKELFAANAEDMKTAAAMLKSGELATATAQRLKLDAARLDEMVAQIRSVAALPDPLGRVLEATELDDRDPDEAKHTTHSTGLHLRKVSVPLGVLAVIFEARPDAVTQIAALALKSGNAVILKPGKEVERTAAALVKVLRETLAAQGLPEASVALVHGRAQAQQLLKQHAFVDLVIPRGSKALVEYVQAHTHIPVLGHAEGVCHIYVDRSADEALAMRVIEDAKLDYPASCNAVETVLVHREIAKLFLPKLMKRLRRRGVIVHACEPSREILLAAFPTDKMAEVPGIEDWHTEYGEAALSVGIVDSLETAITHIHAHGSAHTESIIAEDAATAERFLHEVDAASVMHNVSTRFADGFRYGFGAEVGISTSKFHARGPVGLEGLTTYKYEVRGSGHIAGEYRGKNARVFTHKSEAVATRKRKAAAARPGAKKRTKKAAA